jgi:hypothetical protein
MVVSASRGLGVEAEREVATAGIGDPAQEPSWAAESYDLIVHERVEGARSRTAAPAATLAATLRVRG